MYAVNVECHGIRCRGYYSEGADCLGHQFTGSRRAYGRVVRNQCRGLLLSFARRLVRRADDVDVVVRLRAYLLPQLGVEVPFVSVLQRKELVRSCVDEVRETAKDGDLDLLRVELRLSL